MLKIFVLKLIRFYQKTRIFHSSLARQFFLTDKFCRFIPSCSEYTYQAVKKYGLIKGLFLGVRRILRCHPFSKGGYNPIK